MTQSGCHCSSRLHVTMLYDARYQYILREERGTNAQLRFTLSFVETLEQSVFTTPICRYLQTPCAFS